MSEGCLPIERKWFAKNFDLALLGLFLCASFGGWFEFVRIPGAVSGVDAATVEMARGWFAQAQIALGAFVLLRRILGTGDKLVLRGFATLFLVGWIVEALGVRTGFPFGRYAYAPGLGEFLPGGVPWTIPASWATTAMAAYLLASAWRPNPRAWWPRILATSVAMTAWDLALDPAMSTINGFWTWATPGPWYGVPWTNFLGWGVSGIILAASLEAARIHRLGRAADVRWLCALLALLYATPLAMVATVGFWPAAAASAGSGLALFAWLAKTPRGTDPEGAVPHAGGLDFLGRNSKSFRFASAFLSSRMQEVVAGVYGWCRLSDDLVDEASDVAPSRLHERLDAWEALAREAYENRPGPDPLVNRVFWTMAERGVPFDHARDLLEGLRMDVEPRHFRTRQELRVYSYRVASTIGIWLSRAVGVSDPWVLERAEALGHAMQLTNILRDVGEDLRRGRIYLPREDLEAAGLSESDLRAFQEGTCPPDGRWKDLMESLMEQADRDYGLAREGLPHLPVSLRLAAAVAASVYQGIHGRIRANGYDNFRRRAVVGAARKIPLAIRGLSGLVRFHSPQTRSHPILAQEG